MVGAIQRNQGTGVRGLRFLRKPRHPEWAPLSGGVGGKEGCHGVACEEAKEQ